MLHESIFIFVLFSCLPRQVYSGIGVVVVGLTALRVLTINRVGLAAAQSLHRRMLARLLKAPVSFFDQTPVGRIVNRFSSDFDSIDRQIADRFVGVAAALFDLAASFSVISFVYPQLFLWFAPMFWICERAGAHHLPVAHRHTREPWRSRS